MRIQIILLFLQFLSIVFAQIIDNTPFDEEIQDHDYAEVTYPGIGHFTTKDFYDPIYRPIVLLPQSPERINTTFLLYTRKNLNTPQVLKVGDQDTIKNSYFNPENAVKIIIHGFFDKPWFVPWMGLMKDEFLIADDYNVIIVDWSDGNFPYTQATANSRVVGPLVSILINDLKSVFGIDLSNVHILGHSLGSHIAGYAGERLNGEIGRITGLDPAGPYFEDLKDPAVKLDPTDAQFVDAIHTDAQHSPSFGIGMYETSGHLDFYPNGGKNQPGCEIERWTFFFTDAWYQGIPGFAAGARNFVACSHQRAIDYYIITINNKEVKGVGYQCDDYESFKKGECDDCGSGDKCAILGEDANQSRQFKDSTQGSRFFLTTTDKYPYFKN